MYKLENNVAWTNELKEAFKHGMTRASILYDNEEINEENNLVELTLTEERYINDYGFIGTAIARKLNITIQNTNTPINLENKELTLKIGAVYNGSTYYINYGNFIVYDPPQTDETNGKVTIVAYDYMKKFDQPYIDRVNYPTTIGAILTDICDQAGVVLATTDFANKNFVVEDNQFEGNTLREVLMNIGKSAFSWARIGQDNKLYLDFNLTADNTETITIDEYKTNAFKKASEYFGPVNRVIYADSDIEGQEEKVDDAASIYANGLKELVIYDNLFAYTPAKRQALIQAGSTLFGLKYMPVTQLDLVGFIYLDCNDIINIETLDEQIYTTRVFNHTIQYKGAVSDSVVSEGNSNNQDAYKNTASDVMQSQRTRISVDKANKAINLLSSEVNEHDTQISELNIEVGEISSKVEGIYDLTETVSGNRQVTVEDCIEGYVIEMHIIGNNTVFDYLYPANDLYPADDLYPYGDSKITVTDADGNVSSYELGIQEVLRANDEAYDEYILKDNHAQIIRRVNADGTTKIDEVVEDLGIYTIYVKDGNNTFRIVNYYADMSVRCIVKNGYTDQFVSEAKFGSRIEQTEDSILLEVSQQYVGQDEIISRINATPEQVTINSNKISLEGKTIDLTAQDININSDKFKVDQDGNVTCNELVVTGGSINGVAIDLAPDDVGGVQTFRLRAPEHNAITYLMGRNILWKKTNQATAIMDIGLFSDTNKAYIDLDGDVTCNHVYADNVSDRRVKSNIKNCNTNALEKIMKIEHKQFTKNVDNKHYDIGYIAQEMEEIDPNFVMISKDGTYYINELPIIATLSKAIQEQQQQIEELKNEINKLKGEQYE